MFASFSDYEELRFRRYHIANRILLKFYGIFQLFSCFSCKWRKGRNRISPTTNKIFETSATQLAYQIRTKQITALEVVAAFIDRQREVNPVLNAIVADRYEEALREAEDVDKFLDHTHLTESELSAQKPLLGVPITVKESISVKGMPLAVGAKFRKDCMAEQHGESVRRIIEAGGIPLCASTTPELCISFETENLITGTTKNPYNLYTTCGGSSGGEGALVSSAASVCGLGSDIMGSVRVPAAFCGIFGHKPTGELVDITGHVPWSDEPFFKKCLTIGPLCRYAEDLPLITKVLTDNNPILRLNQEVQLKTLRIHYMEHNGNASSTLGVHRMIKQRMAEIVEHFRSKFNCHISNDKFDDSRYDSVVPALFLNYKNDYLPDKVNIALQLVKKIFGKEDYSMGTLLYLMYKYNKNMLFGTFDVDKIMKFVEYFQQKANELLGDNGILLYPTFPTPAFQHGASCFTVTSCNYPGLANLLGLPATTVPVGLTEHGLPIAIQVIAARNQDRLCFAVAKEVEAVYGGWLPPFRLTSAAEKSE